jgi:hypothetical protein
MQRVFAFRSLPAVLTAVLLSSCGGGSSSAPPPQATHYSVAAPASVNVGTAFNLTLTALDASNNVVAGYSGTVHFTSTDAKAVLPPNLSLANGTATLQATLKSAGGQTITGTDTAIPSLTGTSSSIKVPAATSRFQNAGSLGTARVLHTATLLDDGTVLIAGGTDGTVVLSSSELYDSANGGFTSSGEMQSGARQWHAATLLNSGKVLITGGGDGTSASVRTAELFTRSTGDFAATGNMNIARSRHAATLLPGGKVLVTGGVNASGELLNTAELFDPSTGTFTLIADSMKYARASHNATLLGGKVLITGSQQQAELFDPLTQTFTATDSTYLRGPECTATWLGESSVLVIEFGAPVLASERDRVNGVAQLYDANSGTFALTGGAFLGVAGRSRETATLQNGKVLVAGGRLVSPLPNGQPPVVTASADSFDPVSGSFVPTDDMVFAREDHTATLLNNGDVLISGGRDADGNTLTAAELYH